MSDVIASVSGEINRLNSGVLAWAYCRANGLFVPVNCDENGNLGVSGASGGDATASNQDEQTAFLGTMDGSLDDLETMIGAISEGVPAADTDPSGLNGRLQRLAQQNTILRGTSLVPSASVLTTRRPSVTEVRSTALEASKVLLAGAGQLVQLSVFNSGPAQFLLLMNSATVPANGAVSLLFPPIPIPAATLLVLDLPAPLVASTGIAISNSSTGSFTKTIGAADCVFYAQVN